MASFLVSSTDDSGPGSLRQAILDSNAATGQTNLIDFAIPGGGAHSIAPLSALPSITQAVVVDGFSQEGHGGTPLIVLDGSQAGGGDGLTITGPDVTVRGLVIGGFAQGAGIHITGAEATRGRIQANVLGTDPTGNQAVPNRHGVLISAGAHDNTIGGSVDVGNLIADNIGSGVVMTDYDSVGNQVLGNRIFANGIPPTPSPDGVLRFDGVSYVELPDDLINGFTQNETIEAWFQTTSGGVILGYQDGDRKTYANGWYIPALYVGTDGKLYGNLQRSNDNLVIPSPGTVNDGQWHHAALVVDGASQTQKLYLDGRIVGSLTGPIADTSAHSNQIGTGFTTADYPASPYGWYGFTGQIDEVRIWSVARSAEEVQDDRVTSLSGTEPGLEASYRFSEGQGVTAHDQTPHQRDGKLAILISLPPAWQTPQAIDLGDDGTTENSAPSWQGPNGLVNYPIVVTTSDGGLRGWLAGSDPDTRFHLEFFASAIDPAGGANQAQVYLGSLEVTTDSLGRVEFEVPYRMPAGMPVVTATATDPLGNTSELSPRRHPPILASAGPSARLVSGTPLVFSTATRNALALSDPDAGPLDPVSELSLQVESGTLSLASTAGLIGSGNGTGTLHYRGALSALNAALDGLTYTASLGFHGNAILRLIAQPDGARPLQARLVLSDGQLQVTSTSDSGPGSLRQAILDSNEATGGRNTIRFAIPGPGVHTIAPTSPLPAITAPVVIDGLSQPGYAGSPLIELSGLSAPTGDGLAITGSGVTVRGLAINDFSGAGVLIAGATSSGNTIAANVIGTDPTGSQARPNNFGVKIRDGAHDNLVGGASATDGNLIASNIGQGVVVQGTGSTGNRINANRIFANNLGHRSDDFDGGLLFDGSGGYSRLPSFTLGGGAITIEAWVKSDDVHANWARVIDFGDGPYKNNLILYWVADTGHMQLYVINPDGEYQWITTQAVFPQGEWVHVAATIDGQGNGAIYWNSRQVARGPMVIPAALSRVNQYVGRSNWEEDASFAGSIDELKIWSLARTADQIRDDMTAVPGGTEPGLEAYYPFDEGQGPTTHDQTHKHLDATLNTRGGPPPAWNTPQAIDLGGDGADRFSTSRRSGPNRRQNAPRIVATADGRLRGWLGDSKPNAAYHLEFFAGALVAPDFGGQAEVYLGSLEVMTDGQGQAVFDIPYARIANRPVVTATATDAQGNTSELTPQSLATVESPAHSVGVIAGQPLLFSSAAGDGIALHDPDAGPLIREWDLTLSAPAGTLRLARIDGLVGSGDGTGTLRYRGTVSDLNAALEGLVFTPSPGFHGNTALSIVAGSVGAAPIRASILLRDALFVTTTADGGPGSLRQAILDSNASGDGNRVEFAIPGPGLHTIALQSPLPEVIAAVLIDGTTQPGYLGVPLIAIDGPAHGGPDGLAISASGATIRGLAIDHVAVVTTGDKMLVAQVHAQGIATRLSLRDDGGHVIVESAGISPGNRDNLIQEHLPTGTYQLKVESTGGAGTYSLTTSFLPASIPFKPLSLGTTGYTSVSLASGDFNGDGILDLLGPDGVHPGIGEGTFRSPTVGLGLSSQPAVFSDMVTGDFDGDGRLDAAFVDPGSAYFWSGDYPGTDPGGLTVLLGNGDGSFQPPERYDAGIVPISLVAGDFNGDGTIDLAVADEGHFQTDPGGVSLLLGNGDGTFQPAEMVQSGAQELSLVSGDFNADGRLDLAVAGWWDLNTGVPEVSVLLAGGDGSFRQGGRYAVTPSYLNALSLVVGDFDGDGTVDLAVGVDQDSRFPSGVSVLLGKGDGTFLPQSQITVGISTPGAASVYAVLLVAGDFNGDGRTDLASLDGVAHELWVMLGKGDGTFQAPLPSVAGTAPCYLVAGDFNGDGHADLALADMITPSSGTTPPVAIVLLGKGDGTFRAGQQSALGDGPQDVLAGDFNGDGRLDVVTANGNSNDLSVLLGNGDGSFQPQRRFAAGIKPYGLVSSDFNGDGRLDLAYLLNQGSSGVLGDVTVVLGNGDGTFQPPVRYDIGHQVLSFVAGDFDGDGTIDLAVSYAGSYPAVTGGVSLLLGNGDGTFQLPKLLVAGEGPSAYMSSLVARDFNGDGHLDLTGFYSNGDVFELLGRGDGTFQAAKTPAMDTGISVFGGAFMVAGDLDGDGRIDLALSGYDQSSIAVLLGNGDGTFLPAKWSPLQGDVFQLRSLASGDFNGDGRIDLAALGTSSRGGSFVLSMLGKGDGAFESATFFAAGTDYLASLESGDFNGDGRADLTVANVTSSSLSMLLGLGDGTFADPAQFITTTRSTPLVADVDGDGTQDVLVIDSAGNILDRRGIPGQPGSFEPPVIVNPGNPARDFAWVANTDQAPFLASLDARDDAVSLYAFHNQFVAFRSLPTGSHPVQIVTADLDHDGFTDLVIRNAGDGTLSIYLGAAFDRNSFVGPLNPRLTPATFSPPLAIAVGLGISDVQAVDATGSGRLDLVLTNKLTGQLSVLRNLGDGAFAPPVHYRAGTGLSLIDTGSEFPVVTSTEATVGVAAGPLRPGGPNDLVTINPGSNRLGVLAGLGDGLFANPVAIFTEQPAQAVRIADFSRDGIPDLAVLGTSQVTIMLGDGRGGFGPPVSYAVGLEPAGLSVDDVDGDGLDEVLVGNAYGDILMLVGNGDGTFRPYRKADQAVALAVADLTGDGSPDFVYANQGLDRVVVHYGSDRSTVLADQSSGLLAPGAVTLADLDGDSIPDLIVANSGSNNVLVYPGLGDGQFGPATNGGHGYFVGTNPTGIAVAVLNGQPDLVVANSGSNDVSILLGQGTGPSWTLTQGPRIRTDAGPVAVAVGDILGTGEADLAVANQQADTVQVFPGVGGGFFAQTPATYPVGQAPSGLFLGDFDGSGTGIAALNAGSNSVSLIGQGGAIQTIPTGGLRPSSGFAGDFNANGFTDLVVGNGGDGTFSLLTGGPGGLSLSQSITSAEVPSPTALSFAGLSGGVLSFYAASAGREAASLLAFSLDAQAASAGGLAGGGLASATDQSAGSVLAAATTGAFQQAAQLLGLNGSALDLIAPLITVSVIPGDAVYAAPGDGDGALLANFLPAPGPAVAQGAVAPEPAASSEGDAAEADLQDPEGGEPDLAEMPIWAELSAGVERAWERLRSDILGRDGVDPDHADPDDAAPGREPTEPTQGREPTGPARRSDLTPLQEVPRQAPDPGRQSALDLIDAAIAELAQGASPVFRPEQRPEAGSDGVDTISRNRLAGPVAAGLALASAEAMARWRRHARTSQQWRRRRITRVPISWGRTW